MADLKGTNVAALIVPFTDQDSYATHDAKYGKGGFRSVQTIAERDAIPAERKEIGMVVYVYAIQLNYRWTGTDWVEWLPKGTITVDTALSETSTNPVQNKIITAEFKKYTELTDFQNLETDVTTNHNDIVSLQSVVAAIPKITVDGALNPNSNNPLSNKGVAAAIDPIRSTANGASTKADAAQTTANNAIPKANIDTSRPSTLSNERVLSTKAAFGALDAVSNVANAAIPKSKIDTAIDGSEADQTTVPSVPAVISFVKAEDSKVSGMVTASNVRIANLESWKNTIGTKGAANGVAGLDASGKVPAAQLPSYVDDVIDVTNFVTANPTSGMTVGNVYYNTATKKLFTATSATTGVITDPESDKIYIKITDGTLWRWSGTTMAQINGGLVLGTTSTTAGRGDWVNTLYTNFGSGTNLTGTQAARDFFHNMSLFNSLGNTSILKNLVVQPEANFVRLQNDIVYLIGEVNTGDGYDIPAATTTKAGVMTADMYKTLQEIELATFPLSLTASGGGTFEVGSSNKNAIGIIVTRKGTDVTSSSTITVTASGSVTGSLSSDKKTWTPSTNISSNTSVAVKATYGSQNATKTVNYTFKYKKYWGTSTSASLTSSQVIALAGSTWADSKAMGATTFDCTGGKYVYYVIPSSLGTPEFWVGGLKNTDVVTTSATVTNASGGSATYSIMRLANIQTGVLSVEFK